jgi:valyl-tRNA synthetase
MVKPRLYGDNKETKTAAIFTLRAVLNTALKLLHPYMPFITEEIFGTLKEMEGIRDKEESIMISEWPKYNEKFNFAKEEVAVELIKEAVKGIRNIRTEMNVAPSRKAAVIVVSEDSKVRKIYESSKVFFATLGYASEIIIQSDKAGIDADAVSIVTSSATIYIPFTDLVDIGKETERLTKERGRLESEVKRVQGMLSNPNFINKAPEAKLVEERTKLEKYTSMLVQVEERLEHFSKL